MKKNKKLIELKEAISDYQERRGLFTELMKDVFLTGAVKVASDLIGECGAIHEVDEILSELEREAKI